MSLTPSDVIQLIGILASLITRGIRYSVEENIIKFK